MAKKKEAGRLSPEEVDSTSSDPVEIPSVSISGCDFPKPITSNQ